MLTDFGQEIWISDGPNADVFGFHYPTRMAVIRLSNGDLFIWSPVTLTHDLKAGVDALGPVRHIVAPNSMHHLSLSEWHDAYPTAKIYAPPKLSAKRKDIHFDDVLGDGAMPDWDGEIDQVVMRGNLITTEVVFFHINSGTVLFTDLLQQFPDSWFTGWRKRIAKLDLMIEPEASVPRKFRVAFVNRKAARTALGHILLWPAGKVLMAHGKPVTENAQSFVRRAFRWLT